ncbi:MAG: ParB N-terminal domain-containing protein [Candidatus Bathyarchaeia archaeon]
MFNAVKLCLTLLKITGGTTTTNHVENSVEITELDKLKHHEMVDFARLKKLKEEIKSDGVLKLAIAVDKNTNIIIDGHHRAMALKELGCTKVPVVFFDYNSPDIEVQCWRNPENLTKEDVIKAGLSREKLPPKTSKHMIWVDGVQKHISALEKEVNIPLERLREE